MDRGLPGFGGIRVIDAGSARIVPSRVPSRNPAASVAATGDEADTADVVVPAELEELVEEFRPAVDEIVRRLVLDLAREEFDRIVAASWSGGPRARADVVLCGPQDRRDAPRALPERSHPPRPREGDAAALYELQGAGPTVESVRLKLLASRASARWWSAGFRPEF
jgi:hypothetical protein